ncbi:MAG: Holliday junction branch migration protein RuvA [Bacteroidales bacterium]|nr:Holliday junction branch migration protein RuvA [Bacteroidales bacterium]MDD2425236.1 Holliday junction branch migration protein RuvA [Bacteroidales bacterium]MDD3988925.1 Holliday junction branch migration protein RuvA [Bacteroidales bacterium]MDD4639597.1 Holliday junction branch migration protein RuvA [Bacteroidales bacterium]
MYDYIKGVLTELTPTEAILEANSIGYKILISLQTYSKLKQEQTVKLYIHHHVREDAELMFGFFDKEERYLFVQLTGVSGIGPNTARMMLSSLSSEEIRNAIITSDVNRLKSIKGIGLKTAQRLLIELKDKITKGEPYDLATTLPSAGASRIREEATTALVLLGFSRSNVDKVTDQVIREMPQAKLEEVIKVALKRL